MPGRARPDRPEDHPERPAGPAATGEVVLELSGVRKTYRRGGILIRPVAVRAVADAGFTPRRRTSEVFAAPRHDYTRALLDNILGRGWTPPLL